MPAAQDLFNALRRNPTVKGLPDVNTFEKALQNPEKAGQIYDMLSKNPTIKGLPSKDIFINKFSPKQPQAKPARQEVPASIAKPVPSTVAKPAPMQAQPQQQPNVGERIVQAEVGKAQLEQPQAAPQPKQPTVMQGGTPIGQRIGMDAAKVSDAFKPPMSMAEKQQKAISNLEQGLTPKGDRALSELSFEEYETIFPAQQPKDWEEASSTQSKFLTEKKQREAYSNMLEQQSERILGDLSVKYGTEPNVFIEKVNLLQEKIEPYQSFIEQYNAKAEQLSAQFYQAQQIQDPMKRQASMDAILAQAKVAEDDANDKFNEIKPLLDEYEAIVNDDAFKTFTQLNEKTALERKKAMTLGSDIRYRGKLTEEEMRDDMSFMEGIDNAVQRGLSQGRIAEIIASGKIPTIEDVRKITSEKKMQGALPSSVAVQDFMNRDGMEAAKVLATNFFDISSQFAIESLVAMASHGWDKALKYGALGAVTGAPTGVGAGVGAGAGATVGYMLGGYGTEVSSAMLDFFEQNGVDVNNEESLYKAFNDPAFYGKAREYADKRAIPIMLVDLIFAGIGSQIAKKPAKTLLGQGFKKAGELAFETVGEGVGEGTAQLITTGKLSPKEIVSEMVGGLGMSTPTVAINTIIASNEAAKKLQGEPKKVAEKKVQDAMQQSDVPIQDFNQIVDINEGAGLIEPQAADELKSQYEQAQANKPVKTMQDELQVGDTVEMSPEVTAPTEVVATEQVITEPIKTEEDAFQEQTTDEGVLRQERPELELQGMEQGDAQQEVAAQESQTQEEIKPVTDEETEQTAQKEEVAEVDKYDGIFNPKKTGIIGIDDLITDDGYNFFYKGVKLERVMMSPDEYLKRVREGQKSKVDENITEQKKNAINKAIDEGNKINAPFLSTRGGKFSQEGRNRAVVAKERGEKLIPVFIESDVSYQDKLNRAADIVKSAIDSGLSSETEIVEYIKKTGLHRDGINFIRENFNEITDKVQRQSESKQEVAEERFTVNKTDYIKRGDEYFSKPSKGKEKPITQKVFENAKAKVKKADEGVNISDLEIKDEKALSEISKLPLSHVSGLSMRPDQAIGTYLSTEKTGNRYAKGGKKANAAKVKIKKPYITNDTGNLELRKRILTNNPTAFTQEDFAMYEVPKGRFGIDDLNDTGIRKLAQLTTDYLKSKGYDSIYFPESKTQEGELIVFDKGNVEIEQDADEAFSYTKGGFTYTLRKYGQGKDAKYTRQLKGDGNKELPIDASVYAEQKGKADRRSSRSRQAYESRVARSEMQDDFNRIDFYNDPYTFIVNMLARGLKVPVSVFKEVYKGEQELKAYSAIVDKTQDNISLDSFAEGLQFNYQDTPNANQGKADEDFRDAFIDALSVGAKPIDFMAEAVHIYKQENGIYDMERQQMEMDAERILEEDITDAMIKEAEEYLNSLSPLQLTELQNFLNEQAEYERADKGMERNVGQAEAKSVPSRKDSGEEGVSKRHIGSNEKRAIKRLEDAKKALEAKQKALEDKRNSIRKQQANESQFDIFGKPTQQIEADLDVSERNIQSAIRPFAIDVENAKQEVKNAENAIAHARKSDELQGELFAPTVSEPVSKATTEAKPQAEKGVGETVQQDTAATRQPATETSATDVEKVSAKNKYIDKNDTISYSVNPPSAIPDSEKISDWIKFEFKTGEEVFYSKYGEYDLDGNRLPNGTTDKLIAKNKLNFENRNKKESAKIPLKDIILKGDSYASEEAIASTNNLSELESVLNDDEVRKAINKQFGVEKELNRKIQYLKRNPDKQEKAQAVEELLGKEQPSPSAQAQPQATDVEATAKAKRFEVGKKLSKEEKRDVLKGLKDAYWVNQRPYTIEDTESGERKVYLDEATDYMETSDITGRKLRWFIELPDGRIAHPTEVYGEVSNTEVIRQADGIERADRDNEKNYKKATELIKEKERVADILAKNIDEGNISIRDSRGDYNEIIQQRVVFPNIKTYTLSVSEYINNITDEQTIPNEVKSDQVDWARFISEYSTKKPKATDVATIFESVAQAYADMKNMKPKDARAKKAEIKETLKANPKADFIFTNWNKLKKQLKFTTKGDCP